MSLKELIPLLALVVTNLVAVAGIVYYMASALGKRIDDLDKRIGDLSSNMNERFSDVNNRIDDLSSNMNERFSDVNNRIGDLDKRIDDLSSNMNERFSDVNNRIGDLDKRIGDLSSNMNERFSEMNANINARVDDLRSQMNREHDNLSRKNRQPRTRQRHPKKSPCPHHESRNPCAAPASYVGQSRQPFSLLSGIGIIRKSPISLA